MCISAPSLMQLAQADRAKLTDWARARPHLRVGSNTTADLLPREEPAMQKRSIARPALGLSILISGALSATIALAQMDNGPKTEKTYGIGLPRSHASQLFSDADYPVFPLKPGQEAYKD